MDLVSDYGQDKELAKQFLRDFTYVDEQGQQIYKYALLMTEVANRKEILMTIDMADLERFNEGLALRIASNTLRYVSIFYEALDELLPVYKTDDSAEKDIMDVFIQQRLEIMERNRQRNQNRPNTQNQGSQVQGVPSANIDVDGMYPPDLIRRVEIAFKPSTFKPIPIRQVKAEHIGKLVTIRGIVTRTADVKPKITICCYTCDQCGHETFQPISGVEFTPLFECTSAECKANKTLGRLQMQTRGSKFVKYQEIKIQEHSDQVPVGHIPRTATIKAHGEQTRKCSPGDHVSVSGVFLTIEKAAYRMRTGGLSAETYIEAQYLTQMNKTEDDELNNEPMSMEEARKIVEREDYLDYLSGSIAPEIFGHRDLKIALLLLLVGGVDRSPDGMKVRGNINICMMGDPGVAKSQMLSFVDRLAPRSQLTTGRGSSGVGLTAAVLKDPITNELSLEGGALVLADEGICCIDEFDKMMDADRTAIHEVMEQQTVSIAKAGIMTTLNARVSILAAANPAYGRYNLHRSLIENLQLPAALLSRFDLLWLIRDIPAVQSDLSMAEHITTVHLNRKEEVTFGDVLDMKDLRCYINLCKTKNPNIPEHLSDKLVDIYLSIRGRKRLSKKDGKGTDSLFTSPRNLLAIIRLSTAFARLRLADEVNTQDIDQAFRMFKCSRDSIGSNETSDPILEAVDDLFKSAFYGCKIIPIAEFMGQACEKGLDRDSVDEYLQKLNDAEIITLTDTEIIMA